MLFCCHRYFTETEKRYLEDTISRTHQVLEIGVCPICNTKRVYYEYNLNGKKQKPLDKKGKKAEKLLLELKNQPYYELKDLKQKHGTKNNMFWRYSYQGLIKDFNNVTYGKFTSNIQLINTDDIYSQTPQLAGVFS